MGDGYAAVIDAIYAAAIAPEQWPVALERVAEHAGGTGGMLVFNDLGNDAGYLRTGRLDEELGELYLKHHIRNPVTLAMAARGVGEPVAASQLVTREALRRSALFADILAPQRQVDLVCLAHQSFTRAGATGGIGVTLDTRQGDQLARVLARLGRLAPHLARAVDLSVAAERRGKLTALLGAMPHAALLLNRAGQVLDANDAAWRLLAARDGLELGRGGVLTASAPRVREAIARAADAREAPPRPALRVPRRSGRIDHIMLLTPLPAEASTLRALLGGEAVLLVQVIAAESPDAASARALERLFELTPAEARVAAMVGTGRSVPEAAAALRLAPNTVKTHLARCFDKMGIRSQVALARLVASLPADPDRSGPPPIG